MDSNEVAELLRISTRTLQRLRKVNIISYSYASWQVFIPALRNRVLVG
ncbi:MAG: hypothetical protein LBN74_06015 [Prevotella sp.]|nr:hypothetical protein [Prevotella sp.]